MNLKELTWENHKSAERKAFAGILLSGKISAELYHKYLVNQLSNYTVIEYALKKLAFPDEFRGVFRTNKIIRDVYELENDFGCRHRLSLITKSTAEYVDHVHALLEKEDVDGVIAHMYVRHFGDMYGGAIIAKRVPGSGKMYEFDDKEKLKHDIRLLLNDTMADEANKCFEYAIRLFEELSNEE